ncbi:ABC transporter substrate-binding protein [Pigmentiphaga aceris]|uniref:ABC transporter substrate-binding protein n=1 Tax=Pigmentiphaga aceris TaxID=1940612 RepID=A0A5C0B8I2_9BURK|nr:ABC transporter substrate-binding protein [Pigmentiphaga aceris]QEI09117.1 ABC transporter substrate-binding protein [Pigmentiphaga aceris]
MLAAFAPTGVLRASINLGNPILAHTDPASGAPCGISVDLARNLAKHLGVGLDLVVFPTAGKSVEAVAADEADIGFFAIDPLRGEKIAFTEAYVLIEGWYLVRDASPLQHPDEADQAGHRIAVGKGSAYDLFLSRAIKYAELVRAPTSPAVVDTFIAQDLDIAAGVRQQLEADAARVGGMRLLPGRFMVIQQAMGVPKSRGEAAAQMLRDYVEEMKANGFVAEALQRHGVEGALVAPLKTA